MHLGKSFKTSRQEIKTDLLFWQREVYEKLDHQLPTALKGKGFRQPQVYPQKGFQKSFGEGKFALEDSR